MALAQQAENNGGDLATDLLTSPLPLWKKVSYGLGEIAGNFSWTMVGGFVLFFYTNVALLPATALGTMFLVTRCLDAFADPITGLAMDRTRSRLGRARPYLLIGSVPLGIFTALTFASPFRGTGPKLAYAYITLLLLGALYSVVSVPYGALMPLMTKNPREKVQLSSFRSVGTSIGAILVTSLVMPLVGWLGGPDRQKGFFLTASLFAAVGTFFYLIVFFVCKERHIEDSRQAAPSARRSLRDVAHNRIFLVTFAFTVIHLVRIGCILTVTVYFALNVLHAGWTIPFLFGAMSVGSMLAASVATPYFTKFGFRKGISMSLLFAIAASCLLPLLENYPAYFLAGFCVLCIGAQAGTTAIFALAANACDSQEFKFGSRADGLIFSCISLSTKIGIAVGAALVAYGLGLAQYNPGFVSHEAIQMMRSLFYIVPVALMALQIATILLYRTQGSQYVSP